MPTLSKRPPTPSHTSGKAPRRLTTKAGCEATTVLAALSHQPLLLANTYFPAGTRFSESNGLTKRRRAA